MFGYIIIIGLIVIGLSLPGVIRERSVRRFLLSVFVCTFGILVPIGVFLLSTFLVPEWKGGCKHGWIDCFFGGKLGLSPLVLWATCSLYAVEVLCIERPVKIAVILGLWTGASIAASCFLYCLFEGSATGGMRLWLIVPLYTAFWYGWRAFELRLETKISPKALVGTLVGSTPFWIGSVIWSQKWYESLPDQHPSCFVVTAAARGHRTLVGPFREVSRHGQMKFANQQLLTLWQFESLWHLRAPKSHDRFRRVYNRLGPVIARKITAAWMADAAYLAIKPWELAAGLILNIANRRTEAVRKGHRMLLGG